MPVMPKRQDEKMGHRTKAELGGPNGADKIEYQADLVPPPAADYWVPIARYAWDAYLKHPASGFFTESDLAFGWVTCDAVHHAVKDGSAMKISAAESLMKAALFNEADRRRVHIEVTRKPPAPDKAVEDNVSEFRRRKAARDSA